MRILMWFSIGFAAACAIGAYLFWPHIWLVTILALLLCALAYILRSKAKWLRCAIAVLLGVAVGIMWFLCYHEICMDGASRWDGQTVQLTATATDYSYATDYGIAVEGKLEYGGKQFAAKIYITDTKEISPGDVLSGKFRLRLTHGGIDEDTYHRGNGVIFLAYARSEVTVQKAQELQVQYFPAVLRHKIISIIEETFPEDTAFLAKALLLGDRMDVDYQTNTAFKVSGISHIIAVSGLHVSILFSLVYTLCAKRRFLTALLGIPAVILFAAVAGFTPSITRACVMQILIMLAMVFNRDYDRATALAFAVLLMLAIDPMTVTSASFQLSVGCMIGIFLFASKISAYLCGLPFWREWKGRKLRVRLRQWICGSVSVTLAAMVFTTPLVAYYFGAVSLVGVLTNLLTLWVISFVFYGIMLACLLALLWESGALAVAWLISWPIRYVLGVARGLAAFPLAAVYTRSDYTVVWLVLCYALLAILLASNKKRPGVLGCCALLGLCAALGMSWAEPLMNEISLTVLDVGQGQCVLLQADGKSYLVDCGGDSDTGAADLAAETLLSQGIYRLDGVIVTHYDRDHAGGVGYLLSRIPADMVFLPQVVDEDAMLDTIRPYCGGAEIFVAQDTVLSWEDNSLTVFSPVLTASSNESGLIVLFGNENCDILITGDLSTLGEALLLHKTQLPELDVLVAGHHGSDSSTSEALLAATTPEYVFISVGKDNIYGHPHYEVLDRLQTYGCSVYRTDWNGDLTFRR